MYSPRIQDNQIKRLYLLAKEYGIPMTEVVRAAIGEYLKKHEKVGQNRKIGRGSVSADKPLNRAIRS